MLRSGFSVVQRFANLALLFLIAGGTVCSGQAVEDQPPNIILIMADDLGYRAAQQLFTPELDRLAAGGMAFTHAYSTPLCTPSRVQIMTGKYNFRNYLEFGLLDPGETTFAHILKSAGYRTAISGKWQLGGNAYAPYRFGFDEYCLWQLTFSGYHERYHNPRIMLNGKLIKYTDGEYGPRIYTDFILEFMERNRKGPFFVYFPMALPHRPIVPPPDSPEYQNAAQQDDGRYPSDPSFFDDQVHYLDRLVGEIADKAESLGIAERTLLLFTTDNGTGDEIMVDLNGLRVPGQKGQTNMLGTHVPFIAYWPGVITGGVKNNSLVDFTDILPTVAEAAGVCLGDDFLTDGISIYPQFTGDFSHTRQWVFCHYDPGKPQFQKARYVHNRHWKLYGDGRFYNIQSDPLETSPLNNKSLSDEARLARHEFERILERMHAHD